MTQEEKQLLFQDLCGRLPYNTMITVNDGKYRKDVKLHPHYIFDWDAERWDAKPYLRPMSSMTEEEAREMFYILFNGELFDFEVDKDRIRYLWSEDNESSCHSVIFFNRIYSIEQLDLLNRKHFDYRGLIEKGLAIEAPEGMYDENC